MRQLLRILTLTGALCAAANSSGAQAASLRAGSRSDALVRNPAHFEAVQLLDQHPLANAFRVRFEWDQVSGATQYVLSGRWTTPPSWTMHSTEFRVTRGAAKEWGDERVSFDVTLPRGNHTWELVAVFRSIDSGDFEHPTLKSFEIK